MSQDEKFELTRSALKLQKELNAIEINDAILAETNQILRPLVDMVLNERLDELPAELPRRQTFFFCMYEHCLAGRHLIDAASLLNAIGEFGAALSAFTART